MKQLTLPKLSENFKIFLHIDNEDHIKDYPLLF